MLSAFIFLFFLAGVAPAAEPCDCGSGTCPTASTPPSEQDVRKAFGAIDPNIKVGEIHATDDPGIVEVVFNDTGVVYYAPATGIIYFGRAKGTENLAAKRVEELRTAYLQNIMKSIATNKGVIKIGNGPKTVLEFSDAECGFCRQMEGYFEGRKDITRYVFMVPLSNHPDSPALTKHILCQKDRVAAYKDVMAGRLDGKVVDPPASCAEGAGKMMVENAALAQKLGLSGTPLFFVAGKRVDGARRDLLDAFLSPSKN